jgi:hypothetical protein
LQRDEAEQLLDRVALDSQFFFGEEGHRDPVRILDSYSGRVESTRHVLQLPAAHGVSKR